MRKFVIVIGAPVENMGSQAMLRGLAKNIKLAYPNSLVTAIATCKDFSSNLNISGVDRYYTRYAVNNDKWNFPRILMSVCYRLHFPLSILKKIRLYYFYTRAKCADAVFIIGGDNYDRTYKSLEYMNETNCFVPEIGANKCVLINCSVSKEDLSPEVVEDFRRFGYLTARDSISYENMRAVLPDKDIRFYSDLAFSMDPSKVDLPEGWEENNMIGINLSTLVGNGRYGISHEEVRAAYQRMIDYILNETTLKICFIPHVKHNKDLSELRCLYEYVSDKSRAIIINHENFNAEEKKFIISKLRFFVGARTHATIAAYSSQVPTLVVGYSVKSVGIATDLLGESQGNVVPVIDLKDEYCLASAVKLFLKREDEIRKKLSVTVPSYIKKSLAVQELIREVAK